MSAYQRRRQVMLAVEHSGDPAEARRAVLDARGDRRGEDGQTARSGLAIEPTRTTVPSRMTI
jgi:hypothetical protein